VDPAVSTVAAAQAAVAAAEVVFVAKSTNIPCQSLNEVDGRFR
jgi:hypothetical protein